MATAGGKVVQQGSSVRRGLNIQFRVIGALMLRDLHTRYGRSNIGYLWLIVEPMLLASIIGLIHAKGVNHATSDMKPVPLSLVGYCNFQTFRSIFGRAEGSIEANLPLLYHRNVTVLDLLISRAVLESAGTWLAFAILIGLATLMGIAEPPARPLFLFLGMLCMFSLSFAGSMLVCGLTHERRTAGRLVHPFTYIMMPLSGAFFTMASLPGPLRDLFLWIPLAHIFEILRYGWFKSATIEYVSPSYLGGWLLISTLIGLLLISIVRKRIHMH